MKKGYAHHYEIARKQWIEMNRKCWEKKFRDSPYQYLDPQEEIYIEEHFDEMEQVKIIFDGHHYLKIKWENWSCWWHDCCTTKSFYYCVLLDIDDLDLAFPHEVFR